MDLLEGYGSGSESERSSSPRQGNNTAEAAAATAVLRSSPPDDDAPGPFLLSTLPAPVASKKPLFSGLPAPAAKRRKLVAKFSVPISYGGSAADFDASDDEDNSNLEAKKRNHTSSVQHDIGATFAERMPAPKQDSHRRHGKNNNKNRRLEAEAVGSDDEEPVPGAEDTTDMYLGPGDGIADEGEVQLASGAAAIAASAAAGGGGGGGGGVHAGFIEGEHEGHRYLYDPSTGQYYWQDAASAVDGSTNAVGALEAALAAEAARGGDVPQFKEISGASLRHMDPSQRAEMNAARAAFGEDYETRLRSEAGRVGDVSKQAKRRHQLTSLFVHAKAQELDQIEKRAAGAKTKAETHRKYGW